MIKFKSDKIYFTFEKPKDEENFGPKVTQIL